MKPHSVKRKPKTDQTYMTKRNWYGARTLYDSYPDKQSETKIYEERIVVLQATSFDEAIQRAEKEAKTYANEAQMKYLGFVNVYQIADESIENGSEVYSLMRESKLTPSKYIDTFYETGSEKTK